MALDTIRYWGILHSQTYTKTIQTVTVGLKISVPNGQSRAATLQAATYRALNVYLLLCTAVSMWQLNSAKDQQWRCFSSLSHDFYLCIAKGLRRMTPHLHYAMSEVEFRMLYVLSKLYAMEPHLQYQSFIRQISSSVLGRGKYRGMILVEEIQKDT